MERIPIEDCQNVPLYFHRPYTNPGGCPIDLPEPVAECLKGIDGQTLARNAFEFAGADRLRGGRGGLQHPDFLGRNLMAIEGDLTPEAAERDRRLCEELIKVITPDLIRDTLLGDAFPDWVPESSTVPGFISRTLRSALKGHAGELYEIARAGGAVTHGPLAVTVALACLPAEEGES